jgi:hypothetical protein
LAAAGARGSKLLQLLRWREANVERAVAVVGALETLFGSRHLNKEIEKDKEEKYKHTKKEVRRHTPRMKHTRGQSIDEKKKQNKARRSPGRPRSFERCFKPRASIEPGVSRLHTGGFFQIRRNGRDIGIL